jgi:hypothetical protein
MQQSTQIVNILQAISILDFDEQIFVTEILNKRMVELRRNQILMRAKEAEQNYEIGNTQTVSVENLMMMSSGDD